MGFIFGGNTGINGPEDLQRRRAMAQAVLARNNSEQPRNIWEGLNSLATSIGERHQMDSYDKAETEGRASADAAYQPVIDALSKGGKVGNDVLLGAMNNEWANDGQRAVGQFLLKQNIEENDPMRKLQLEKGQLELDALRNPKPEFGFTTLPDGTVLRTDKSGGTVQPIYKGAEKPTDDIREYLYYSDQTKAAGQAPLSFEQYMQSMKKAGAASTSINNNMGSEKFGDEFAKGDAQALSTVSQSGLSAQRNIARINRLDDLLSKAPQGAEGAWKQWAGEYGINTQGLDNIQSAQALINALVPEQRPPGSGPMSDGDVAMFKQSIPRIINQPGGNRLIMNTMRAIAQYDAEGATIVQKLRRGEIDRASAFDMLQNRVNPLDQLNDLPSADDIDAELKKRGVQ